MVSCWLPAADLNADHILNEVHCNELGWVYSCPVPAYPNSSIELFHAVVGEARAVFTVAAIDHAFPTRKKPVLGVDAER